MFLQVEFWFHGTWLAEFRKPQYSVPLSDSALKNLFHITMETIFHWIVISTQYIWRKTGLILVVLILVW